ncbi:MULTISPECIES: AraC family transcriptional regulator [Prauserella salsuginis group]|uniref:AraC family transcriptional regulator n=1 Tax=Prauserella salsuginis TaxID=387889 RepID=A0ABW6GAI9_9PSEU|nr:MULTISPECIES: AraC family transcriptional regulator [Prauserella salsuginis group]MCR3722949.1 AraC-type DNA-binding protein [Prauserella flava]MCR3737375.1 AraC-type DNA-binding protein [Prauserella salsuginis]
MAEWDFPRGVASTALLAGFAEELGQSVDDVLAGTGLDPAALRDPQACVTAEQELTVVRNLVRRQADRDPGVLGLRAGTRYHATSYGIWGYAVTSCETVREAVELALRYIELTYVFCLPELRIAGRLAELRCQDDEVPADVRGFLVARDIAAIVTLVREQAAADLRPAVVSLRVPEPADMRPYREALGVVPEFGDSTRITFPREVLDQPMPQASVHTLAWCERQCRELLDARRRDTDVATRVRRALAEVGPGAGMTAIAARLSLTERTLRRRLAAEGVSYRDLVDGVRRRRAEELLTDGTLTVEQISNRLGYSEPSSFLHAFARWHGMSPREFSRRTGSVRRTGVR